MTTTAPVAPGEDPSEVAPTRWRRWWPVLALALVAFVLALTARHTLMPLGTGNADEGVYTYQAELLRHGDVTLPAAEHEPFFRPWLTGSREGRLFFQYEPLWPLVLAASDAVFGSMEVGVALCFAGLVVAVHALAAEALRSRRTALLAAAFTVATPMLVWQSAMRLSYLFTTLLATLALAAAFRGARTADRWWWLVAGALVGAMVLTRPFDAVLTAGAAALVGLFIDRSGPLRERVPAGLAAIAGGSPFVIAALVYNALTTGSWRRFPLMASDPMNQFGFGQRRMQVGSEIIDYPARVALESLRDNLVGSVGWMFGGLLALALAVWALTFAQRRGGRLVLLAYLLAFPLGYLFWWATKLAAEDVTNGIGPHYYVPAFVPLIVLSADGLARLSRRHLGAAAGVAAAMVVVTAYQLPGKIDVARFVTDYFEEVDAALAGAPPGSVVFLRTPTPAGYLVVRYPFLLNDPDLDGPVLYAVDLGAENAVLASSLPDRRPYLLHQQVPAGGDLFDPEWLVTELALAPGPISVQVTPPAHAPELEAYVIDGRGDRRPLQIASDGSVTVELSGVTAPQVVVVGVEAPNGERWERAYDVVGDGVGGVLVLRPGTGRHVVDFGNGPVTINEDVSPVLRDVGTG